MKHPACALAALALVAIHGVSADGATAVSEACAPRTGCWGVAPKGPTWRAILPEHSGTGTLVDFFGQDLRVATCAPRKAGKHLAGAHAPPRGGCADDVWFVLAANPFRRVISSAAWHKQITGGRRQYLRAARGRATRSDERSEVAAFRAWVARLSAPPVQLASDLVADACGAALTYVLRTNHLQEDALLLLDALGYARKNFTRAHCISSCATKHMRYALSEADRLTKQRFDARRFYDAATAERVRRLYARDFSFFAFSNDPARMFE